MKKSLTITSQKNTLKNSRLIRLVAILDGQEFRRLGKFVKSPFYNYSQPVIKMYEHLKGLYPDFEGKGLRQEVVWRKLFPNERFSAPKLWRFMAKMIRLLERFLAVMEIETTEQVEKSLYINALSKRNLYKDFEKETQSLLEEQGAKKYRDLQYYADHIQFLESMYFHPLKDHYQDQEKLLRDLSESIDAYFMLSKLRLNCVLQNRDHILSTQHDLRFMTAIDKALENGLLQDNIWQQLYSLLRRIQAEPSEEHYFQFKDLLFDHIDDLRRTDQLIIFYSGLNYLTHRINRGKTAYYKESLTWYKRGLKSDLLIENERMSEVTYGNIILLGCREGDFDWTRAFIDNYQHYLDDSLRKDAVLFNTGLLHFYRADFETCIACYTGHSFSKSYFINTRLTVIRATYELFLKDSNYYELLITRIEAFDKNLFRNRVFAPAQLKSCNSCVRLIKGMAVKQYAGEDKRSIKKWVFEILESEQKIMGRGWLQKKAASL